MNFAETKQHLKREAKRLRNMPWKLNGFALERFTKAELITYCKVLVDWNQRTMGEIQKEEHRRRQRKGKP